VALCVPPAALGEGGDRVLLAICVLSFVGLVAGMYALGKPFSGRSSASSPRCCSPAGWTSRFSRAATSTCRTWR